MAKREGRPAKPDLVKIACKECTKDNGNHRRSNSRSGRVLRDREKPSADQRDAEQSEHRSEHPQGELNSTRSHFKGGFGRRTRVDEVLCHCPENLYLLLLQSS